jgi:hypothetical protein
MYRYRVNSTVPRPESFCDDVNTAQDMELSDQDDGDDSGTPATDLFEARQRLWRNLASAAESGWDFSCESMIAKDESNNLPTFSPLDGRSGKSPAQADHNHPNCASRPERLFVRQFAAAVQTLPSNWCKTFLLTFFTFFHFHQR